MDQTIIENSVFMQNAWASLKPTTQEKAELGNLIADMMAAQNFVAVAEIACMDVANNLIPASQKKRLGEYIGSLSDVEFPRKLDAKIICDSLIVISSPEPIKATGIPKLMEAAYPNLLYKAIKQNKLNLVKKYINRGLDHVDETMLGYTDFMQTVIPYLIENNLFGPYDKAIMKFYQKSKFSTCTLNLDNEIDFQFFKHDFLFHKEAKNIYDCFFHKEAKNINEYIAMATQDTSNDWYLTNLISLMQNHPDQRFIDKFISTANTINPDHIITYVNFSIVTENLTIIENALLKFGKLIPDAYTDYIVRNLKVQSKSIEQFEDWIKMLNPLPLDIMDSSWHGFYSHEHKEIIKKYIKKN